MLIYDVADQMTHGKQGIKVMGEQIPLSYKYLERLLDEQQKTKLRNKKIPILNREEFLKIATNVKCPRDILEEDDIEVATKFLHNIGKALITKYVLCRFFPFPSFFVTKSRISKIRM